ncbi:MAG: hypothetical protein FIA96_13730 [Betaproteobacteria bacterium]|nr:hypothetical protein [Betaproteobacteria bacterium]
MNESTGNYLPFMGIGRFSQFHENPAVIAWWGARLSGVLGWLKPSRRRAILALASIGAGALIPFNMLTGHKGWLVAPSGQEMAFVIVALFAVLGLIYRAAVGFSALPGMIRRHPQLALHLLYWGFLAMLWAAGPITGGWRTVLFGMAMIFPFLIWRCAFLLLSGQHGRMAGTGFSDHLIYLWPAYGGNDTPYGKGLAYLSQCEAKTEVELARSQLAGIRLILLGFCWGVVMFVFEGIVYGEGNALTRAFGGRTLGIPALGQLVKQGAEAPFAASWASVYCELMKQVLRHAAGGHVIIGLLRLFGFNVFRNTYKPLLAESVVEFWNRYYYYFKELMVTFFFLPTYAALGRRLGKLPQLRLFAAVFAAAFFGNVYYHLIRVSDKMAEGRVLEELFEHRSRIFYCFLLALGVFVSMLRQQRLRGRPLASGTSNRVLRIAGVWTFFALIFIWNVRGRGTFANRVDFFLGMFGLA